MKDYLREELFNALWTAVHGQPNLIQVVTGPRQIGKTTLALQVMNRWRGPKLYQTADQPNIPSSEWIVTQWNEIRKLSSSSRYDAMLVLDEVQKISHWSDTVKKLFDEDRRLKSRIRVVLLGSSALLMQKGLTESLAGRFELHRHTHWSYAECKECFGVGLPEYLYFGGYPGAIPMRRNQARWARFIRDSLIETVLSKDVFLMMPVAKPALLRQVFGLAVTHPAQVLSYQKILGQLQDAGNATTIASYIKLLGNAFLIAAIEKYSGSRIKQKSSSPKLLALDNALVSAMSTQRYAETKRNKPLWGRMVENAVGAKLYPELLEKGGTLFYWRERQDELDYVVEMRNRLIAIEVKSSIPKRIENNFRVFKQRYSRAELVLISSAEKTTMKGVKCVTLEQFFMDPLKSIK